MEGIGFDLQYQANLMAHGAAACAWLWKKTGEAGPKRFLAHLLAGFFHNTIFWESNIGHAQHYSVLLGATCLHDGPYMAMYECWESYALFCDILEMASGELPTAQEYLIAEYCRRALHCAWFFYPAELPEDAICPEPRSGRIDRRFAFPLEDIYAGGDTAGKAGQEVYGCGAAWAFTTRAFRKLAPTLMLGAERPFATFEMGQGEARFAITAAGMTRPRSG